MSYPSDFQTIQNGVISKLRLDATDDLAKVKDWINRAYFFTCIEVGFFESSTAATALSADATNCSVPSAIVKIDYIVPTNGGITYAPMEEVTFEEILELRTYSGGSPTTGAPYRYAFRSSSSSSIEFWPNAAGGEVLTFYGDCLPTALSSDSDMPIFPEPYATELLEYGAMVKAAEFKKDPLLAEWNAVYMDWVAKFKGFNNHRAGAKTQQFKVEGRTPIPKGNSIDYGN